MSDRRQELQAKLVEYYRSCGFKPRIEGDGTVRAAGIGGVTWIGVPVLAEDLPDFPARLRELSEERMPAGELCPLELLPEAACEADVREALRQSRIADRRYVEVYSVAA